MKFIQVLAIALLFSCGGGSQPAQHQSNADEAQSTSSTPTEVFPIPYYLGAEYSGSWVIEMSMEQNGSFSVILKDSGEGTQYQGSFQKSPPIVNGKVVVSGNESLFNGVFEGANSGQSATIRIKGEACTSKSGAVSVTTCKIQFGNKNYEGCGKFVE